jgi:hypothetical protein
LIWYFRADVQEAAMNDLAMTIRIILFLLGWYSAFLLLKRALAPAEKLRFVWCPEASGFSLVETYAGEDKGKVPTVKNCSRWPEYEHCEQQCIR